MIAPLVADMENLTRALLLLLIYRGSYMSAPLVAEKEDLT